MPGRKSTMQSAPWAPREEETLTRTDNGDDEDDDFDFDDEDEDFPTPGKPPGFHRTETSPSTA